MLKALFGKEPTPKEQVRESKREMRKGEREIQRDIQQLQMEEKKTIAEIKVIYSTGSLSKLRWFSESPMQALEYCAYA